MKIQTKRKYVNPALAKFVLFLGRKYFEHAFNIEVDVNETKGLEPPYLVLPNHLNTWDPGFVNIYIDHAISWVTSDVWFTKRMRGKLLDYVGAIPKTKYKSDFATVKAIIKARNDKRVIGVFPEGSRSWDGASIEMLYPTAKLVKMLKIPVVCVLMKGGYLSLPRWAHKRRKGKISMSYKVVLRPEEIARLSVDEIYHVITTSLAHDEYAWQREHMNTYVGKNMAESLELFLFICPHCKSIGTMRSRGDEFYCTKCNYLVKYNKKGFLEKKSPILYYNNPKDWNAWQLEHLKKLIDSSEENDVVLEDGSAIYHVESQGQPVKKDQSGSIQVVADKLIFTSAARVQAIFDIENIQGLNVKWNDQLEFYHDSMLNRFSFSERHVSAYKWVKAIKMLKEKYAALQSGSTADV